MQLRALVLAGLAVGCASRPASPAAPPAEKAPSKVARWTSDLKRLDEARRAGDARTAVQLLGELRDLAPNNPQLQLAFARVAAERGDTADAARWLGHYAAAGMTLGPQGAKLLEALAGDPHLAQLTEQLAANGRAMGAAERVFELPTGDKLFEDVVWVPSARSLYITSVRDRRVYAFDPSTRALRALTEPEPEGIGVLDIAFDPTRNVLWMSTAPLPPVPGYRKGDDTARASSVATIDPSTGRILQRIELRPDGKPHALGDALIAVQNGTHPPRVVRLALAPTAAPSPPRPCSPPRRISASRPTAPSSMASCSFSRTAAGRGSPGTAPSSRIRRKTLPRSGAFR